jgi:nitroreductase
VDTYLAVASKRDERRYAHTPIPDEVARRILDAGRVAGSSRNRQPWTFVVVRDRARIDRLAETVYATGNVLGAALVVAVVVRPGGPAQFDGGRAAQNMMLAAWNEGVVSCPNGMPDQARAGEALGLGGDEVPLIVLSFGYPVRPRDPEARSPREWIARADRKPFEEVVRFA